MHYSCACSLSHRRAHPRGGGLHVRFLRRPVGITGKGKGDSEAGAQTIESGSGPIEGAECDQEDYYRQNAWFQRKMGKRHRSHGRGSHSQCRCQGQRKKRRKISCAQEEKFKIDGRVACPFANTGRKRGPPDAPQVGLLSVGPGDLADKCGPADVHGRVNLASLRSSIILEDFHHQGCVVRDKTAGYYEPSRFAGLECRQLPISLRGREVASLDVGRESQAHNRET